MGVRRYATRKRLAVTAGAECSQETGGLFQKNLKNVHD
jgi:hypothetical protein